MTSEQYLTATPESLRESFETYVARLIEQREDLEAAQAEIKETTQKLALITRVCEIKTGEHLYHEAFDLDTETSR